MRFGEDEYYKEIIKEDFRGFDYETQRDSWREGNDFAFHAEFYAVCDNPLIESEEAAIVDTEVVREVVDVDAENASP